MSKVWGVARCGVPPRRATGNRLPNADSLVRRLPRRCGVSPRRATANRSPNAESLGWRLTRRCGVPPRRATGNRFPNALSLVWRLPRRCGVSPRRASDNRFPNADSLSGDCQGGAASRRATSLTPQSQHQRHYVGETIVSSPPRRCGVPPRRVTYAPIAPPTNLRWGNDCQSRGAARRRTSLAIA